MPRYVSQIFVMLMSSLFGSAAHANAPIKLYYETREPYAYLAPDGSVSGSIATNVAQAFHEAGISYEWVMIPFKRQLQQLEANAEQACGLGFFKTVEREKIGKFSHVIYVDKFSVMLAHKNFRPAEGMGLFDAMSIKGARMLRKEASFYGAFVEDVALKSKPLLVLTTAAPRNMALMIAASRADFMLVTTDEAKYLMESIPESNGLHIFKPVDMPAGQRRYLLCSNSVPDEVINRFNRAISK
jgi:polar amino acid transport system substrate-binding protein